MAWVMARMWASVNDPRSGEPRCPLVPKLTSWPGSSRSGLRLKYSRSSRAGSISISFGAGLPAKGEMVMCADPSLCYRAGFCVPNLGSVLGDRAVAREFPGAGDIQNRFPRPSVAVRVEFAEPLIRREIGFEVRQVHVVVPVRQQRVAQRGKDPGLVVAEIVGENQVQCGASLRLVVVMPVRVVPTAAARHLVRGQAEQEEVLLASFFGHLDGRAVARADRQCP